MRIGSQSEKTAICKALLPYFVSLIVGFAPYFKSNFTVSNDVIPFVNGLCDSIAMWRAVLPIKK